MTQNTDGLFKHAKLPGLDGACSADFRGLRVLIPLCGDTPALKFFAELGCHVTGIDLVQKVSKSCRCAFFESDFLNLFSRHSTWLKVSISRRCLSHPLFAVEWAAQTPPPYLSRTAVTAPSLSFAVTCLSLSSNLSPILLTSCTTVTASAPFRQTCGPVTRAQFQQCCANRRREVILEFLGPMHCTSCKLPIVSTQMFQQALRITSILKKCRSSSAMRVLPAGSSGLMGFCPVFLPMMMLVRKVQARFCYWVPNTLESGLSSPHEGNERVRHLRSFAFRPLNAANDAAFVRMVCSSHAVSGRAPACSCCQLVRVSSIKLGWTKFGRLSGNI
jgi:hypothetical protein